MCVQCERSECVHRASRFAESLARKHFRVVHSVAGGVGQFGLVDGFQLRDHRDESLCDGVVQLAGEAGTLVADACESGLFDELGLQSCGAGTFCE